MKYTFIALLLLVGASTTFAHKLDTVLYQSETVLLTQNFKTKKYKLVANKTYTNLKFVKRIYYTFQVLDANNTIFYIKEEDGKRLEKVSDFIGVCGTVPHYSLSQLKSASHFEIYEDETFYDHKNEMPAEITAQVSFKEADSVLFINGRTEFNFTSNFDVGIVTTDPRMLIFVKNGQYFTQESPELKYDWIDFSTYHYLKTKKNNLFGILGLVAPKYKSIEKFNYYLAKVETVKGEVVYIDNEGNEY